MAFESWRYRLQNLMSYAQLFGFVCYSIQKNEVFVCTSFSNRRFVLPLHVSPLVSASSDNGTQHTRQGRNLRMGKSEDVEFVTGSTMSVTDVEPDYTEDFLSSPSHDAEKTLTSTQLPK